MKKSPLLFSVITLLFIVMTIGISALSEEGYTYTVTSDNNAVITDYTGTETEITIPQTLGGHTVVGIGYMAFSETSIVSVVMPDTVTSVGYKAFENCKKLKSVTLSKNLTEIESYAFSGCTYLEEISIPSGVTEIAAYSFYKCTWLEKAYMHDGIKKIGKYAFCHCTELDTLELPRNIETIGAYAFYGCGISGHLVFPDSLCEIGEYAYYNCDLTGITVPEGVTELKTATFRNNKLADINLPNTMTAIGDDVFYGNYMVSVYLPDSITSIGEFAFSSCEALEEIHLPIGIKEISTGLFCYCQSLEELVIPEGVETIGEGVFFGNHVWIKKLVLPKSIKKIGYRAFYSTDDNGMSLSTTYYAGSAEEFLKITFDDGNNELLNSNIIFNAVAYTFYENGGSNVAQIYSKVAISQMPTTTRNKFEFVGWYDNAGLSGNAIEFPYISTSSVDLYAKWRMLPEYAMDFNGDTAITVADVMLSLKEVLDGNVWHERDMSGDGKFSLIDTMKILKSCVR